MNKSIIMVCFFLFITACTIEKNKTALPKVHNGKIDLTNTKKNNGILETVELNGTWEFYWGELISPEDFSKQHYPSPSYIEVPGSWNNTDHNGKKITGSGYATFRAAILLPEYSRPLAIEIDQIGTNYKLFINGVLTGSRGITGTGPESSKPGIIQARYIFQNYQKSNEIILQVSNFHYRMGGVWDPIKIGDAETMASAESLLLFYEAFLIGSLLVIGFYHIVIILMSKKNYAPLYFGLVCCALAARQLVMDHKFLMKIFPETPWWLYMRIEYLSLGIVIPLFALYFYRLIEGFFSKKYLHFLIVMFLLFFIIVTLTNSQFYSQTIHLYELNLLIFTIYSVFIIFKASFSGNIEARYLLLSGSILFLTVINDLLVENRIINTIQLSSMGILIFTMSQAVILAKWFTKSHDTSEKLFNELLIKNETLIDANKELIQLKENLDEKIRERTKTLEIGHKTAEDASQAKSIFLANMSHEIRTPLNNVHGYIELMGKTPLNEEQYKYLHIINKSAKNLLDIINDILDFSKIESGKFEIDNNVFNPELEFQSVIELFYLKAIKKKLKLLSFIEPELPAKLLGDPLRIKQVLTNLLSNAIKFTEVNGIVKVEIVKVKEDDSCIEIGFSVSDTGIGIPDYKQKKIFESFEQETSSITGKYGGTGLGLSISLNLVDLMGGELKLDSEKGKGSKFYFNLQLSRLDNEDKFIAQKKFNKTINVATFSEIKNDIDRQIILNRYLSSLDFPLKNITDFRELKNIEEVDILFYIHSDDAENHIFDLLKDNENVKLVALLNHMKLKKYEIVSSRVDFIITQPVNTIKIIDCIAEILIDSPYEKKSKFQKDGHDNIIFNAKILVAEDNISTQDLMKIMLQKFGMAVDIANNGLDAINKFENNKYDIIFLDINMPVYNGIEVAEMIIDYEKKNNLSHTPLVALTAMAVKGDKDKILSSGLDEYLSKPINFNKLNELLENYLEHLKIEKKKKSNPQGKNDLLPEQNSSETYNINYAAKEKGIATDTFKDLITKAFPRFYDDLENLKIAIDKNDFENIYQLSHKLKGSFYNYMFNEIGDIASGIELNSEDKNIVDYSELYNKMIIKLEILKNQILP